MYYEFISFVSSFRFKGKVTLIGLLFSTAAKEIIQGINGNKCRILNTLISKAECLGMNE
jgi:hypothetical protein